MVESPSGKTCEVPLHGPNLIEKSERIQRRNDRAKLVLRLGIEVFGFQEPGGRCRRRAVCLADSRADALLAQQLERRLKEVDEQPRAAVEPRQRLSCYQA